MPYVLLEKPDSTKEPLVTPVVHVTEVIRFGDTYLDKDDGRVVTVTPEGNIEDRDPGWVGAWEETSRTPKGNYSYGGKHILMAV
jgi:hypothetical protein